MMGALYEILVAGSHNEGRAVMTSDLAVGMILAEDVLLPDRQMLLARGYEANPTLRARLKNFSARTGVRRPIKVIVRAKLVLKGS